MKRNGFSTISQWQPGLEMKSHLHLSLIFLPFVTLWGPWGWRGWRPPPRPTPSPGTWYHWVLSKETQTLIPLFSTSTTKLVGSPIRRGPATVLNGQTDPSNSTSSVSPPLATPESLLCPDSDLLSNAQASGEFFYFILISDKPRVAASPSFPCSTSWTP